MVTAVSAVDLCVCKSSSSNAVSENILCISDVDYCPAVSSRHFVSTVIFLLWPCSGKRNITVTVWRPSACLSSGFTATTILPWLNLSMI